MTLKYFFFGTTKLKTDHVMIDWFMLVQIINNEIYEFSFCLYFYSEHEVNLRKIICLTVGVNILNSH